MLKRSPKRIPLKLPSGLDTLLFISITSQSSTISRDIDWWAFFPRNAVFVPSWVLELFLVPQPAPRSVGHDRKQWKCEMPIKDANILCKLKWLFMFDLRLSAVVKHLANHKAAWETLLQKILEFRDAFASNKHSLEKPSLQQHSTGCNKDNVYISCWKLETSDKFRCYTMKVTQLFYCDFQYMYIHFTKFRV